MLLPKTLREALATVWGSIAPQPLSRFNCGDCDRHAQCGSLPHDDCIQRLTQLARDGDSSPRRPKYFYPANWPR